jgi:hypothetical protein
MDFNKELPTSKAKSFGSFRATRSANCMQVPQITIRGDNNLINLGTRGVVKVGAATSTEPRLPSLRNGQWPQQILDAIRVKAARNRRSNGELCELAGRVLGRAVVTLERLSPRDLARVYEAVCANEGKL